MKSLNEVSKREFALRILNVLTTNLESVKTAGVDPTIKVGMLKDLVDASFADEDAQIRIAAECRTATAKSRASTYAAYAAASGVVDMIVGTVGAKEPFSRELRSLRKAMSHATGTGTADAVAAKAEKKTA
ncbi:MAG: hypothetical protein HZC28_13795 [Spirochaetes bacterium]|nr:hypothetical protein [Spirochaetota bacterium]